MTAYNYRAIDQVGKLVKGIVDADNERMARQLLREKMYSPLEIILIKQTTYLSPAHKKIKTTELTLITSQMAALVAANIPIADILTTLVAQAETPTSQAILSAIRARVMEGFSLATAMSEFPRTFSPLYCASVRAGEESGRLALVLEHLATYLDDAQTMRQRIQQALIYPAVMTTISLAIVSFLLSYVVPQMIQAFETSGQVLPPLTVTLLNISSFVKMYGLYLLGFFIALGLGFRKLLQTKLHIRRLWHHTLLRIPIVGKLLRLLNTARFTRIFSILATAGVPVIDAMRHASALILSLPIEEAVTHAVQQIREGASVHLALKQTGYFTPMSLHLMANGEASGQLPAMLERIALLQNREVARTLSVALTLFEPLLILIMGGVVLFIVLAVLLPIFTMDQMVF